MANDLELWESLFGDESGTLTVGLLYPVVGQATGSVRRKPEGSVFWRDVVSSRQPVSNGDSVFTGPDGTATLELTQIHARLELPPGSLVVVKLDDNAGPLILIRALPALSMMECMLSEVGPVVTATVLLSTMQARTT